MSSISGTTATFLQSTTSTSNWLLDAANANAAGNADWFGSSVKSDPVILAANAFAAAHQISSSNLSSLAVSKGIATLRAQLGEQATGQSVNFIA
jgi:hypothetical protein